MSRVRSGGLGPLDRLKWPVDTLELRHDHATGKAPRSTAPGRDPGRLPRAADGIGALLAGEDEGALYRVARRGSAALDARPGPRVADSRVLAAAGLDRPADAARGERRQAEGPHGRDPAVDRSRAALGARLRGARRA